MGHSGTMNPYDWCDWYLFSGEHGPAEPADDGFNNYAVIICHDFLQFYLDSKSQSLPCPAGRQGIAPDCATETCNGIPNYLSGPLTTGSCNGHGGCDSSSGGACVCWNGYDASTNCATCPSRNAEVNDACISCSLAPNHASCFQGVYILGIPELWFYVIVGSVGGVVIVVIVLVVIIALATLFGALTLKGQMEGGGEKELETKKI